jgi:hypothetical protein
LILLRHLHAPRMQLLAPVDEGLQQALEQLPACRHALQLCWGELQGPKGCPVALLTGLLDAFSWATT